MWYLSAILTFLSVPSQSADSDTVVHPSVWQAFETEESALKVWIFLADKGIATEKQRADVVNDTKQTLAGRALARRALRGQLRPAEGELVTEDDLPVSRDYVRAIESTGVKVALESRWLNAVSAYTTRAQVSSLCRLQFVTGIQPVARGRRVPPDESGEAIANAAAGLDPLYGLSYAQLEQINLVALHQQGFTGEGVIIGVLDTGFQRTHAAFNEPGHSIQVLAEWDFVKSDGNTAFEPGDPSSTGPFGTLHQHSHGTWILGVLGSYKPGQLVGGAYDASFVLAKVEDVESELPIEEDRYVAGLEFIEKHGADLATSSLGYTAWLEYGDMDGQTAVSTQAVNIATSMGLVCLTGVGNGGRDQDEPSLIAPSDAFDVIACGAVDSSGTLTGFSSAGPTADGRVKPEVLALGESASSVSDSLSVNNNEYDSSLDGTSLATPMVASAVACILQAHPDWTVAQLRKNLLETASTFAASGVPDLFGGRGYGIVHAFRAAQDCNDNNVADFIDLKNPSLDCNVNNVIDRCDIPGDFDADSAITLTDAGEALQCMSNPCAAISCSAAPIYASCCALADFDDDGDVDLLDFAQFANDFTEP